MRRSTVPWRRSIDSFALCLRKNGLTSAPVEGLQVAEAEQWRAAEQADEADEAQLELERGAVHGGCAFGCHRVRWFWVARLAAYPRCWADMRGRMETRRLGLVVVPLVIGTLIGVFALVGFLAEASLDMPRRLQLPTAVRVAGLVVLAFGFAFMEWIFRYRRPAQILVSTFETMRNSVRKQSGQRTPPRTEPLVVQGPHRHVRHPLYFAVVVLLVGW